MIAPAKRQRQSPTGRRVCGHGTVISLTAHRQARRPQPLKDVAYAAAALATVTVGGWVVLLIIPTLVFLAASIG